MNSACGGSNLSWGILSKPRCVPTGRPSRMPRVPRFLIEPISNEINDITPLLLLYEGIRDPDPAVLIRD